MAVLVCLAFGALAGAALLFVLALCRSAARADSYRLHPEDWDK